MAIQIYNTLTGQKEPFEPLEPGRVRMYNCGPTVYDYFHVGNLRTFLFFDVVRGWLEYRGYRVRYIQNFTDIDDKLIRRAAERGITVKELADEQIRAYFEDADALGIVRADVHPRVSEKIGAIIGLIQRLIDQGYAYVANGDVFFDVSRFRDYGKLSGQRTEQLLAGARVEASENKRNPLDFALWKAQKPGEPAWDSPWGPGRPGWHIECSAMAMDELGTTLDIHSGGSDLVFPHHENEIAQSEAATGKPFARYWMHVALVQVGGQRMGKSMGNFWRVRDLRARFHPEAIRLFILSAHYRNPLEFSLEALEQAERARQRLTNFIAHLEHLLAVAPAGDEPAARAASGGAQGDPAEARRSQEGPGSAVGTAAGTPERAGAPESSLVPAAQVDWPARLAQARAEFEQAMDDDFNTADALAALFTLARDGHKALGPGSPRAWIQATLDLIRDLGRPLRLFRTGAAGEPAADAQALLDLLVEVRQYARSIRDYELADRIRDRLAELGYILEDTPAGTRVRRREHPEPLARGARP
ncbi:cysteine--tRNA ligase [Thermaerobacter sp. PB12/4term]|nr:cysteine--tRNA ligase [Thermaerobacter sp. PB12/4term]